MVVERWNDQPSVGRTANDIDAYKIGAVCHRDIANWRQCVTELPVAWQIADVLALLPNDYGEFLPSTWPAMQPLTGLVPTEPDFHPVLWRKRSGSTASPSRWPGGRRAPGRPLFCVKYAVAQWGVVVRRPAPGNC